MEINCIFNLWDNIFTIISIVISSATAFWIYKLTKSLSAKDKFQHEQRITEEIRKLPIYAKIILADVLKYNSLRRDYTNETYYKQGGELYDIIPEYGIQIILHPNDSNIPVGIIPFEWIEYIRLNGDSEDSKPIIICRFKGIKWYRDFRSPFKEINYIYQNPNYRENQDPEFMKYRNFK